MTVDVIIEERKSWEETPPPSPALRHLVYQAVDSQKWLDRLATPLQNWLATLSREPDKPLGRLKDILNGTWLGHPVHPALANIPIGSWAATILLDIMSLRHKRERGLAHAADLTLTLGLVGAAGSALTGLTNWSDLQGTERRMGMMHGLLNGGITGLYLVSSALRRTGQRRAGIALSTVGYAVALFSAYLGGEMAYAEGVNVNRMAWAGGPNDFVSVMSVRDLPENKPTRVDVAGVPVMLVKQGKNINAIGAVCSHLGGPLDEGKLEDGIITCPWHGSRFNIADGSVVNSPALYAQPCFQVRLRNDMVELRRVDNT